MSGGLGIGSALGGGNPLSIPGIIGGASSGGLGGYFNDIVGLGLGTPSQSITRPFYSGTDYSSVNNGVVSIDPSIRNIQNQGISAVNAGQQQLGQAVGAFGSNLSQLRQQLTGNQNAFLQARTRPTERLFAQRRGELERSLGRRNLGGSSIASKALDAQASTFNQDLADQRAMATQESINAGLSVDQLMLQAQQLAAQGNLQQAQFLQGIAQDRANLESGLLTAAGTNTTGRQPGLLENVNIGIG